LGIYPKPLITWRKRETVEDIRTGSKEPKSTVLNKEETAADVGILLHISVPMGAGSRSSAAPRPKIASAKGGLQISRIFLCWTSPRHPRRMRLLGKEGDASDAGFA
jgi:hypothetical protein